MSRMPYTVALVHELCRAWRGLNDDWLLYSIFGDMPKKKFHYLFISHYMTVHLYLFMIAFSRARCRSIGKHCYGSAPRWLLFGSDPEIDGYRWCVRCKEWIECQ